MGIFSGNQCYNGGQKHNFQPRYTEEPKEVNMHTDFFGLSDETMKRLSTRRVYEFDICVWCGKKVAR